MRVQIDQNKGRMSRARQRLIARAGGGCTALVAAERVAAKLMAEIKGPPTDLEKLAEALGVVELLPRVDMPGSGQLIQTHNGFIVIYNPEQGAERIRWTIAHELAHIVFQAIGPRLRPYGDDLERLCDAIAAEFLMPRNIFRSACYRDFTLSGFFGLLALFRTSITATAIRVSQTAPAFFLELENDSRRWITRSPERDYRFADSELHTALELVSRAPRGSTTVTVSPRSRWWSVESWALEWRRLGTQGRSIVMIRGTLPLGDQADSASDPRVSS